MLYPQNVIFCPYVYVYGVPLNSFVVVNPQNPVGSQLVPGDCTQNVVQPLPPQGFKHILPKKDLFIDCEDPCIKTEPTDLEIVKEETEEPEFTLEDFAQDMYFEEEPEKLPSSSDTLQVMSPMDLMSKKEMKKGSRQLIARKLFPNVNSNDSINNKAALKRARREKKKAMDLMSKKEMKKGSRQLIERKLFPNVNSNDSINNKAALKRARREKKKSIKELWRKQVSELASTPKPDNRPNYISKFNQVAVQKEEVTIVQQKEILSKPQLSEIPFTPKADNTTNYISKFNHKEQPLLPIETKSDVKAAVVQREKMIQQILSDCKQIVYKEQPILPKNIEGDERNQLINQIMSEIHPKEMTKYRKRKRNKYISQKLICELPPVSKNIESCEKVTVEDIQKQRLSETPSETEQTPKYCNRKGRKPKSKTVVVERKLCHHKNMESNLHVVRLKIISQESDNRICTDGTS